LAGLLLNSNEAAVGWNRIPPNQQEVIAVTRVGDLFFAQHESLHSMNFLRSTKFHATTIASWFPYGTGERAPQVHCANSGPLLYRPG
jgi:hypothetical protein